MAHEEGTTQPADVGPVERPVRPLAWTEELPPMEGCRYHHVDAMTAFGRFRITWKGWKEHDWLTVDEVPWGDGFECFGSWPTLEQAKRACEQEFARRVNECLAAQRSR